MKTNARFVGLDALRLTEADRIWQFAGWRRRKALLRVGGGAGDFGLFPGGSGGSVGGAMHHAALLNLLKTYQPIDAADAACAVRFAEFIAAQPRCFERSLPLGHVTGSAWIMDAAGARVLLTHHAKLDIWVQPGGHCDGEADVAAVARREAQEETGLMELVPVASEIFDLDIHPIPARGDVPAHEHYDVRFALQVGIGGEERFVVSDESHDLAWVPLGELERLTRERSMLRMREKWWRLCGAFGRA